MTSETRQRTVQLAVRFTPDEYAALELLAEQREQSAQQVIRDAIAGASLRVSADDSGDNQNGATRAGTLAAPNRTPLIAQEAG